jgi:hypothetical protein
VTGPSSESVVGPRPACRAKWRRGPGCFFEGGSQGAIGILEGEDQGHAGEVETGVEEPAEPTDASEVVLAVAAGPAVAPGRRQETLAS